MKFSNLRTFSPLYFHYTVHKIVNLVQYSEKSTEVRGRWINVPVCGSGHSMFFILVQEIEDTTIYVYRHSDKYYIHISGRLDLTD